MDFGEVLKRGRRILDGNFSNRKTVLILLGVLVLVLYLAPTFYRILNFRASPLYSKDSLTQALSVHLNHYANLQNNFDVHIRHVPPLPDEKNYLPYVGFRVEEAVVAEYLNGVVSRFQYWDSPSGGTVEIAYHTYAHRSIPSLLMQTIKVTNPTKKYNNRNRNGLEEWNSASTRFVKIYHGEGQHDYLVVSGSVDIPNSNNVLSVSIVTRKIPPSIEVKSRESNTLHFFTSVNYSDPILRNGYKSVKDMTEHTALKNLKDAVSGNVKKLRTDHSSVWQELWLSGFSISESKAENTINGDLINATIYNVLSQSPAPLHELHTVAKQRESIMKDLAYAEGCYGGHHTLQAETLWSKLDSIEDINNVVSLWIMTLEKQGCHQLVRSGADGVMQGILLSLGGFQFKNQHLEFNADPSHLHRDYFFRRISYGNATHLNISVVVQEEDYKAVLYIALDRSDKYYYGCDAGCLDPPVQLGPEPLMFPIKLTQPLTAILYITSDKVHMEELKHTIHVKEVAIAPAHHHHVIAMHKHGHKWGGLPTLFWFTIIALIVIFHLFLFKLVVNEYCGSDIKTRYRKHSDF
ncbi:hypothetical protein Avbf_07021 [Armadillidium vulgare]|nr:hypothetical protein Avbf_07021 [Armadillidium vulgare]